MQNAKAGYTPLGGPDSARGDLLAVEGEGVQHRLLALPREQRHLGVDVEVIITAPCILCIEDH